MDNLIVIGNGGHSKVIQDIIHAQDTFNIHAILDDSFKNDRVIDNVIYRSTNYIEDIDLHNYYCIIAIGDNSIRKKLAERVISLGGKFATLIHPSAVISPSSVIKEGTVVMPNAVINANTTINQHCIINSSAVVEHDNVLDDFVHISPGAVLAGGVSVKTGTHIGSGAVVIPGIEIGTWNVVGAGSVVTKNLPSNITAVGVPAKIIKE